jgi:nitrous oxide reductase accessory protein NosL
MKKLILLTAALILSLIVGGCSDNDDANGPDPRVAAFRSAMEESGFAVSEGSTKQIDPF